MEVRAFIWTTRDGLDCCIDIVADYIACNCELIDITSATIDGEDVELTADECDRSIERIIDKIR